MTTQEKIDRNTELRDYVKSIGYTQTYSYSDKNYSKDNYSVSICFTPCHYGVIVRENNVQIYSNKECTLDDLKTQLDKLIKI
jgi:hypothetical protein